MYMSMIYLYNIYIYIYIYMKPGSLLFCSQGFYRPCELAYDIQKPTIPTTFGWDEYPWAWKHWNATRREGQIYSKPCSNLVADSCCSIKPYVDSVGIEGPLVGCFLWCSRWWKTHVIAVSNARSAVQGFFRLWKASVDTTDFLVPCNSES